MKKFWMILLPVLVLAIGGVAAGLLIKFRKQPAPQPVEALVPLVRTTTARPQDYQFTVHTQGTVTPRTEIDLVPEVSGRVISISPSLAAGGFFVKGELLLALDPRDYELAVARAKAQLAEASVRVAREEAEAEVARQEWEKLGQGKPSPLLLREPQLVEARAAQASAQAALKQAEFDLERCRIEAPFAGRVSQKSVDIGQFVTKGAPAARLYSVEVAEVRLPLSLEQLAYLDLPWDYRGEAAPAPDVRVSLEATIAGQREKWQGRIARTEGRIEPRTRMLIAVAEVNDPYGRGNQSTQRPPLSVGLFVEAQIEGRREQGVFVLPRAALRGDNEVLIVDAEERLRLRKVEILQAGREEVVLRSGLADGDIVCLSTLDAVVDGMKVRTMGEAQ